MKPRCCIDKKSVDNLSQTAEFLKIISEKKSLENSVSFERGKMCLQHLAISWFSPKSYLSSFESIERLGLVSSRQEELKVIYSINKKVVKKYSKLLNNYLNSYGE